MRSVWRTWLGDNTAARPVVPGGRGHAVARRIKIGKDSANVRLGQKPTCTLFHPGCSVRRIVYRLERKGVAPVLNKAKSVGIDCQKTHRTFPLSESQSKFNSREAEQISLQCVTVACAQFG